MNKRQFVGKTLEDALDQAAREFDTDRHNLGYTVLPNEGGGLLKKLLFRSIRIEAWLEHTEDLQAAARRAVREAIDGDSRRTARDRDQNNARKGRREDKNQAPRETSRGRGDKNQAAGAGHRQHHEQQAKAGRDSQRQNHPSQKNRTAQQQAQSEDSRQGSVRRTGGAPSQRRAERTAQDPSGERTAVVSFDTPGVHDLLLDYTDAFLRVFDAELPDATFTRLESGDMSVTVQSETLEDLLQRSDKLASSYEHIFKRIVQKKLGDLPDRLVLDAGQASAKRAENLQELARSLAARVKETGKSVTLNSRSGQERRVIHLTIDEIEGVATRSIGTGEGRKLVIYSTERAAGRHKGGSGPNHRRNQQTASATEDRGHGESGGASSESPLQTGDSGGRPSRRRSGNNRGRGGQSRRGRQSADQGERGARPEGRTLDPAPATELTAAAARSDESY